MDEADETKRTSGLVMHHAGKVLDSELGFVAVFRRDVVAVELVLRVEFVQHRGIRSLEEEQEPGVDYKMERTGSEHQLLGRFVPLGTCSPHR